LELILLGPVEARSNGTRVPLAPLERNLLAILALAKGTVLSTERIIDSLWDIRPPASPRSRVQGLVSSLRRKIGDALVTRNPGYLLAIPDGACDALRCEDLARQAAKATSATEVATRLRDALGLWQGEPLDGVSAPGIDADRVRLAELRLALSEDCFEAELGLGKHAELVRELVAAIAVNPLRERLTGQLMVALYRSNRQAEALRAYDALRKRLAEELGSDPCADLRELHAMILRGDGPPRVAPVAALRDATKLAAGLDLTPARRPDKLTLAHRPAQMPASVGHFLGRDADLATLTAALPGPGDEPRVLLVSGAGGLGKTALAVHWAHAVADRFPDGQIFVDLRGSIRGGGLSPGSALGAVLVALGLPVEQLPVSVEERAAVFRTRIHGRRVLLVADDAASVGQLLPLVPPTPGSLIVVTSRSRLTALTAHHAARTLVVQPLDPVAARDLLHEIVGPERLCGDGVTEVVELCGGWPLAIRLAGATLAARSTQSLSSFAEELRERVDVLSVADDPRTVRAALAQAHASLDPAAQRLLGQLGLLPGTSVSLQLAAAAAGTSAMRARRLLDELISANLVVETGPDRYWFDNMILRFARRCGALLTDREVVEERVIRWYLATFDGIARLVAPDRDWPAATGPAEWRPFKGDDPSRFLDAERSNVPAVVRWLSGRRDPGLTWHFVSLAYAASAALPAEACELGLAAAEKLDSQPALGEAHAQLGSALLLEPARGDEASGHLTLAVDLLEPGHGHLACTATFGLGSLRNRQGRPAEARSMLERALGSLDPGREPLSYAVALFGYAEVLVQSGSVDRGQERFAQALILSEATVGSRFSQGWLFLDHQLADEFLAYLTRSLDAPRACAPDRRLARTLVDLCVALRSRAEASGGAVITLPRRKRQVVERYSALS
jgi:DNA-binding SARP family transcriptional activator/tetratricopeptide (TPR) repeat protein